MKELRALKRVFKLWNLNSIYEQVLKTAYQQNVKIFNEREFYNYFQKKEFQLAAIDEPILVLKHDVDRMLSPIAVIDKIEKKYKAASTYHVRADEAQYSLAGAQNVFKTLDVALHLVGDVAKDKQNFLKYFPNVIGCSTHGGHEKQFIFNNDLIAELSEHFAYVSDGLLRPESIRLKDKFLLIPIDSADIYFEDLQKKVTAAISKKQVMILNTHVEYFTPWAYLKRQFMQVLK